jgi:hypothetical protein
MDCGKTNVKTPYDTNAALKRKKGMEQMKKKNIGSSFDSWLREEGLYEQVTANAIKRVLARQVEAAMKEKQFSKAEMVRRMRTSRAEEEQPVTRRFEARLTFHKGSF